MAPWLLTFPLGLPPEPESTSNSDLVRERSFTLPLKAPMDTETEGLSTYL